MKVIEGNCSSDLSHDLADLLSSVSSQKPTGAAQSKEFRKAPRFRVKWHAEIFIDGQKSAYCGTINDISTQGSSVYLNSNLSAIKCTLHIYVPSHNLASKPYLMAVSGKIVYTVHDGNKQHFRAGVIFLKFNPESDFSYLDERLTKHHLRIPEFKK